MEEEYRKATKVTLVLVEKEAMSSPSSSKMKVVGTAVWLVRSSTCSVHLIMSRWVLVNHPKIAADLPSLVLHQGDVEPVERCSGEHPGKRNYLQEVLEPLKNLCASTESVETATRLQCPSRKVARALRKLVDASKKSPCTQENKMRWEMTLRTS